MPVSDSELSSLSKTADVITLGMRADEVRRRLHDARTTFVRVADVPMESRDGAPIPAFPPGAGEIRIVGAPKSRSAAVARVR
jgi:hypothetical protein